MCRGSSGVALSTAFGHYLRYYLNCDFHWEDGGDYSFASFPKSASELPILTEKVRVTFLSKWRYYQNTCTASYSFVWKTWSQHEREIDWAAMNGFNLPLAFVGQEIVWQKLWKSYGVSDEGLAAYFSGPAFLTWQRMANLRAFGGPLSDRWIELQAQLQRQILMRYAELGLTPVMPAFNGVVPEEMTQIYPDVDFTQLPAWVNFPTQYTQNFMLPPTDPLFVEIGTKFLQLQEEVWGEVARSHIYNADTFNENSPPDSSSSYLASASDAVYTSITSYDPQGIWLMQGWLFVYDTFWTDEHIAAYLGGVPNSGMIVLDLTGEDLPVWQKISANKKQFIWCMLHNYGGSRALYGNLTLLATDPLTLPPAYFAGVGLSMEAIDQNPIVYEFMAERGVYRGEVKVEDWVGRYVDRRYNVAKESAEVGVGVGGSVWSKGVVVGGNKNTQNTPTDNSLSTTKGPRSIVLYAWRTILSTIYRGETPVCHHPCLRRSILTMQPSWDLTQEKRYDAQELTKAWGMLVEYAVQLQGESEGSVPLPSAYYYDLVDVGRQVMSNLFLDLYSLAQPAYVAGDMETLQSLSRQMLSLIRDWDRLLSSHRSYLLGRWIEGARGWGGEWDVDKLLGDEANVKIGVAQEGEVELFDYNARNQITLWGDTGEINDYAAKNWGGLAQGYYLKRWQLFLETSLESLKNQTPIDWDAFNAQVLEVGQVFCGDVNTTYPTSPCGDPLALTQEMYSKYGAVYSSPHGYTALFNTDSPSDLYDVSVWSQNVNQLQYLCDSTVGCVGVSKEGKLKYSFEETVEREGMVLYVKNKCSMGKGC
ncbi:alpha-N-acetylglucosaminidase [archaeon]|nr:MAG: alpha-N-acetylglucosaminidase [archaeon]